MVLARRPIRVIAAAVSLSAPDEAIAGTAIQVTWTGPNNAGDYITLVTTGAPDNQYGNYTNTSTGSPLTLLTPIMNGSAELRYVTGQRHRVLARRSINIVAAKVTLAAPPEGQVGSAISITWTGPNNPGDYITVVPKATPDGQYGHYTNTDKGSPLSVNLPKEAGDAEVRYMTGQGNKVLARVAIKVLP
jgi:Ca-activated chloride channel family protein